MCMLHACSPPISAREVSLSLASCFCEIASSCVEIDSSWCRASVSPTYTVGPVGRAVVSSAVVSRAVACLGRKRWPYLLWLCLLWLYSL